MLIHKPHIPWDVGSKQSERIGFSFIRVVDAESSYWLSTKL